ncbi:MAG: MBL fold metallo-hydrolase [Acidimicrobiales bacterium]|nr:MBL fold metallo-hydrolase [Acidimicrobiales bacterium]
MRVTFWGAAETVTGSRFVVDATDQRILVDCGLFQGLKRLRQRNWDAFPVDPASIDAVVLTHAHIDHSGYLPALVRDGFTGAIWCTPATARLAEILLRDSAHLHEEDARYHNKHRTSRHDPALPLYTTADAQAAIGRLRPHPYDEPFHPASGVEARFSPAGHILGSASIRLDDGTTSITFSGDVGRPDDPIMKPPAPPPSADYVVTESTYGNRRHADTDPADDLAEIVTDTMARGGTLLIPVFAVGRAQTILHLLSQLRSEGRIPEVPTYLNSPMAINATELFCAHPDEHRLTDTQCMQMCGGVTYIRTADESKELTPQRGPMIALSASGMLTGGRILHHLRTVAPNHRSTIALVGYQAAGTRGDALLNGTDRLKIFGDYIPVRARTVRLDNLSAHADATELTTWLASTHRSPKRAFIVHGEPTAADTFRRTLHDDLEWATHVPTHGETIQLT